jgi:hypothetical protein
MRKFRIITATYGVPVEWLQWSLDSIDTQAWPVDDVQVCVVVDDARKFPELAQFAQQYCEARSWCFILRDGRYGSVRNQYDAVHAICHDPEDVVVWVDGDGDQLAHPQVLNILDSWYAKGFDVTYGSYRPFPPSPTSQQARPWPEAAIRDNSYRWHARYGGGICFNHLRTMKYKLIQQMSEADFKDQDGKWIMAAADSVFMFPALELSRGNHKCIPAILLNYHADHEGSEWRAKGNPSDIANDIVLLEKKPK